jgi:hypothetical protein
MRYEIVLSDWFYSVGLYLAFRVREIPWVALAGISVQAVFVFNER